ncbi:ABC transporter ATP-binding protein [Fusibacillus kribbianus]|uniref:ABC transporter ATP-binding protein n=1 Tax=Fusibacillus kribbianus TaxID=3044208 RepID=A0AAP4B7W5_9FIRM|nr:ABC transporter ATP-binding protein [Ruminococcus sp. YH-rum2234]MDI9241379.1 ABC transporter ATP-binding protein [Ruminococcus sp. YH-rum2234]
MQEQKPLLEVKNLRTYFYTRKGVVPAVDGVDFQVAPGEILGIVGESGCGKSVTSLSILNLLIDYAKIEKGSEINFDGRNLVELSKKEMCKVRGKDIAMIFQDPMTSLNPVMTIEKQLMETVQTHRNVSKSEARKLALDMMIKVGIPSPEKRLKEYPHQLSGGMKQRVMIAMALMCNPKLLIADEPTTALDVTIQAQILKLMRELKDETGSAIMLITHDMGVVASMADAIMIMYAGRVVEYGRAKEVFKNPKHPYTVGLLKSIPRLDEKVDSLFTIEGTVPNQYNMPAGCKFWPRCPYATEKCKTEEPSLIQYGDCQVRCWKYDEENRKEENEA